MNTDLITELSRLFGSFLEAVDITKKTLRQPTKVATSITPHRGLKEISEDINPSDMTKASAAVTSQRGKRISRVCTIKAPTAAIINMMTIWPARWMS